MLLDFLDLPNELVVGFKFINLALAALLLFIVVSGVIVMRSRSAYQLTGKYAMYGLFYFALGGMVAAIGNAIPGEQEVLALVATAFRVAALVYLLTHVTYNLKHFRDNKE